MTVSPSRVQQALRLYAQLLDKTCSDKGVRVQIARITALVDDMTPREEASYYAGAHRLRLARHHAHERTRP
jgi:hypothetical protein